MHLHCQHSTWLQYHWSYPRSPAWLVHCIATRYIPLNWWCKLSHSNMSICFAKTWSVNYSVFLGFTPDYHHAFSWLQRSFSDKRLFCQKIIVILLQRTSEITMAIKSEKHVAAITPSTTQEGLMHGYVSGRQNGNPLLEQRCSICTWGKFQNQYAQQFQTACTVWARLALFFLSERKAQWFPAGAPRVEEFTCNPVFLCKDGKQHDCFCAHAKTHTLLRRPHA
jgi:hypothetical protein